MEIARVACQMRIARPTDRLEEVVRFYRDGLGLRELGRFEAHAGYDGVMLGLPDASLHLEFTQHEGGSPGAAPSRDNLLVFYLGDEAKCDRAARQLESIAGPPVAAENPYWASIGAALFLDPDGWVVVLVPSGGLRGPSSPS